MCVCVFFFFFFFFFFNFKLAKHDCSVLYCATQAPSSTVIKIMRGFG